ncbi:MAG: trypsin-like peptidase domain-containing protein [Nocardioidaceae bacterium]
MDDQTPAPQQHSYFAPPVGPFPESSDESHQPEPHRPRRRRRLLATVTATALVTGLGGVGAGYALGHGFSGGSTTTSSSASGQTNVSTNGNGDWSWSDGGQGSLTLPADPSTGPGQTQIKGSSTDTTAKASGSQLTGLVRIATTLKYSGGKAAGTGMVLTSDGEIVTNHHVVAGATSIKVKVMSTGTTYTAKVVGTDTQDDVAVLQLVGASGLDTVTTDTDTDTDGVSVGDAVTAVGDANGTVSYLSAASGSILAEDQTITTQSEANVEGERLTGLLKISSDVIAGDSGGATYDDQGEVVGMTTAASSGSNDVIGYAVPIAKVLGVADDLENGVVKARYDYAYPAFLGVGLGQTAATVQGVYKSTPAADAGIVAGDTVTAIDGTKVGTSAALRKAVGAHSPGDSIAVTWAAAGGTSHTATVTLAEGPVR